MLTGKITEIYDEIWARKSKEIRKVEKGSRMDIASKLVDLGDRLLDSWGGRYAQSARRA
ncbi:MAG: hypothetical protein QMC80_00030 [Thermoplasmatales archaeon]|nr:hypothetical protein [Thermoplasmatales archaeon]